jgi:MoxR-like ATPase
MSTPSFWYLERDHTVQSCEILRKSPQSREIRLTAGPDAGKALTVHPEGVIWGRLFPRVLQTDSATTPEVFVVANRALVRKVNDGHDQKAVPPAHADYRFQPFISDVIDSVIQGQNVILTGGTGVGKTTHITQLANRINQPLLRINFNGETRMSDLVGKVHVIAGETRWMDGVLPMAMRNGWWLLLDELDFAEPAVLSLLHPVLEEESVLVLKENSGEIIHPHPSFRLFATANSIGAMSERAATFTGTNDMNEAFLDRWQVILVNNLSVEEEIKVLRKASPGLRSAWARRIAEFAKKARDGDVAAYHGDNFSTRKTLAWAKKAELHRDPIRGAELAWLDKVPVSDQEPLRQALRVMFGTGKRSGVSVGKKAGAKAGSKGSSKAPKAPGLPVMGIAR